jgi:hypothetical protein
MSPNPFFIVYIVESTEKMKNEGYYQHGNPYLWTEAEQKAG